ncbi:hypothetical protein [Nocardia carnea]|uniref:hypothetical protein n=1 Tax=Nocardia carnea TaxID=37328 RepID=UPI002453B328|nr:hypothetical protein [Nocardia carnea]
MTTVKTIRCDRCHRRGRGALQDWNCTVAGGEIVGVLCPDCQTVEEYTEAEINLSTLDYGRDEQGRVIGSPKGNCQADKGEDRDHE